MARQIILTEPASAGLEETQVYLRRRNPVAARTIVRGIYQPTQILLGYPESGSLLGDELYPSVRKLVYRSYLIGYRYLPVEDVVPILRVWHTARGPVELEDE